MCFRFVFCNIQNLFFPLYFFPIFLYGILVGWLPILGFWWDHILLYELVRSSFQACSTFVRHLSSIMVCMMIVHFVYPQDMKTCWSQCLGNSKKSSLNTFIVAPANSRNQLVNLFMPCDNLRQTLTIKFISLRGNTIDSDICRMDLVCTCF